PSARAKLASESRTASGGCPRYRHARALARRSCKSDFGAEHGMHRVGPEQRRGGRAPLVSPELQHVGRLHVVLHLLGQESLDGRGVLDPGEHYAGAAVIAEPGPDPAESGGGKKPLTAAAAGVAAGAWNNAAARDEA